MLIIKKKKIIFTIFILILSCFVFFLDENKNNLSEYTETSALPVSEKTIILDAGHRRRRSVGAVSSTGISEADINLSITLKLQTLLEQSGATIILTRSTDEAIYDANNSNSLKQKKISDLKNRVKIGNESSADLFVSIHLNKIPQEQYYGWQTFYKKGDENSKKLAESIQENLNISIQKENHRTAKTIENIYIIDNVEIPIAIVECGFLSNPQETQDLQNDEYQDKLAWGIYNGIMDWMQKNSQSPSGD